MIYLDTIGLANAFELAHDHLVDVRRFRDAEGRDVLVVDNPTQRLGLAVEFGGKSWQLSHESPLSIIECSQ